MALGYSVQVNVPASLVSIACYTDIFMGEQTTLFNHQREKENLV